MKAGDKIRRIKDFHEGAPDSNFVTHLRIDSYNSRDLQYWSAKQDWRCFESNQWELVVIETKTYQVGDIVVTVNGSGHTDNCCGKPAGYIFRIGELSRQSDKIFYRKTPGQAHGVTAECIRPATAFEITALELGVKNISDYGGKPEVINQYQIY